MRLPRTGTQRSIIVPDHPARHLRGHVGLVMRKALQLDRNACQRLPTLAHGMCRLRKPPTPLGRYHFFVTFGR